MSTDHLQRPGLHAIGVQFRTSIHEVLDYTPHIDDARYPRVRGIRRVRTALLWAWSIVTIYYAGAAINLIILFLESGIEAVLNAERVAEILLLEPILHAPALGLGVVCCILIVSSLGFLAYHDLEHEQAVMRLRAERDVGHKIVERLSSDLARVREQIAAHEARLQSSNKSRSVELPIDSDSPISIDSQIMSKVSHNSIGLTVEQRKLLGEQILSDVLLAALNTSKIKTRLAVVDFMARMPGTVPVEPVMIALADPNEEVRASAVQVLRKLEPDRVLTPLLDALKSADPDVRMAAMWALGQIADHAPLEPILGGLQDEDARVRKQAVLALQSIPDRVPVEAVIKCLDDDVWEIRQAAVRILQKLSGPAIYNSLLPLLDDPEWEVRKEAIESMGGYIEQVPAGQLIAALNDPQPEVRDAAVRTLGLMGERAPIEAVRMMLDDEDSGVRLSAKLVMWALGQEVPPETDTLEDD